MQRTIREKYWRYALYTLLIGLGLVIFIELAPFMGGFLGAITIYILQRSQMRALTIRHRMRRSLAAWLLIGEAIICFLIPLSLVFWALVTRLENISLDPSQLMESAQALSAQIMDKTGYDLLNEGNLSALVGLITQFGQWLVGAVFSFAMDIVVLLFVLYFMLVGGARMERYLLTFVPFNRKTKKDIVHEMSLIVRSNAIGVPLLAIIQGIVAVIGYWAFGVPAVLFCGLLTCVTTIIPIVGSAIVWVPLALYMGIMGHWGLGIGLALYGALVITQVDNLARFVLQRRMADTHPLVTMFGVIIGLSLFGFMGVIFGPVLLSVFLFCADLFKRRYLDDCPTKEPATPIYAVPAEKINTPEAGQ